MISSEIISDVLYSVQKALLGHVTPNLRAVFVHIKKEYDYELIFYYHEMPSEDEEELASLADTEFIADFPSPECHTECSVRVLPYPEKIRQEGHCVYYRYEK